MSTTAYTYTECYKYFPPINKFQVDYVLINYFSVVSNLATLLRVQNAKTARMHVTLPNRCSILSKYIYIGWLAGPFNLLVDIKKGGGGRGGAKFKFYKNNKASMLSKFSFINRTTSTLKMFD